jgi:UDP-N-acetylmuramate--alanine ligase
MQKERGFILTLLEQAKQIHFIGIGGYGMSALALILLKKGYRVSGSDIRDSSLTASLVEAGAEVVIGHRKENIGSADLVIYSTAIAGDNPETEEAVHRGIPLWHRSELLAALLNSAYGIAVAGAHGKTTTTAMLALLLEAGGLDPTAVVGGVVPAFKSNARLGSGPHLVAEADESDSSFTRYYPRLAIVTGIEPDHLEHYNNDYALLQQAYADFLSHLPAEDGIAVLNADDPALRLLGAELNCRVVYYSADQEEILPDVNVNGDNGNVDLSRSVIADLEQRPANKDAAMPTNRACEKDRTSYPAAKPGRTAALAEYRAVNIFLEPHRSRFDLAHRGEVIAPDVTIGVPGLHNVSNATAAFAAAACLGLNPAALTSALAQFTGVGRRFELIGEVNGITVIDDYAHHPTEIRATLKAAHLSGRRVLCLFQPHRYSRTAALFEEFVSAFIDSEQLFLHAIYPAGETPLPGITSVALAKKISVLDPKLPVTQDNDISILEKEVAATAQPGDLIITMGAGDITYSAPRILNLLRTRHVL